MLDLVPGRMGMGVQGTSAALWSLCAPLFMFTRYNNPMDKQPRYTSEHAEAGLDAQRRASLERRLWPAKWKSSAAVSLAGLTHSGIPGAAPNFGRLGQAARGVPGSTCRTTLA